MRIFNTLKHTDNAFGIYGEIADSKSLLHRSLFNGDIINITIVYFLTFS